MTAAKVPGAASAGTAMHHCQLPSYCACNDSRVLPRPSTVAAGVSTATSAADVIGRGRELPLPPAV
ncbi:hypothetical protein ACVBEQ_18690 [Nakamurella sp. GG22]